MKTTNILHLSSCFEREFSNVLYIFDINEDFDQDMNLHNLIQ